MEHLRLARDTSCENVALCTALINPSFYMVTSLKQPHDWLLSHTCKLELNPLTQTFSVWFWRASLIAWPSWISSSLYILPVCPQQQKNSQDQLHARRRSFTVVPAPYFIVPVTLMSLEDSSKSNPRGPEPQTSSMIPLSRGLSAAQGEVLLAWQRSSVQVPLCIFKCIMYSI